MTPVIWTWIFILSLILVGLVILGLYILQNGTNISPISNDIFLNFQASQNGQVVSNNIPTLIPGMGLNVVRLIPGSIIPIISGGLIIYSATITSTGKTPLYHTINVNNQVVASFQDQILNGSSKTIRYTTAYNDQIQTIEVYWWGDGATVENTDRNLTLLAWT